MPCSREPQGRAMVQRFQIKYGDKSFVIREDERKRKKK